MRSRSIGRQSNQPTNPKIQSTHPNQSNHPNHPPQPPHTHTSLSLSRTLMPPSKRSAIVSGTPSCSLSCSFPPPTKQTKHHIFKHTYMVKVSPSCLCGGGMVDHHTHTIPNDDTPTTSLPSHESYRPHHPPCERCPIPPPPNIPPFPSHKPPPTTHHPPPTATK
jgi:hypothetical protein